MRIMARGTGAWSASDFHESGIYRRLALQQSDIILAKVCCDLMTGLTCSNRPHVKTCVCPQRCHDVGDQDWNPVPTSVRTYNLGRLMLNNTQCQNTNGVVRLAKTPARDDLIRRSCATVCPAYHAAATSVTRQHFGDLGMRSPSSRSPEDRRQSRDTV